MGWIQPFLAELDQEMVSTRKVLERIPNDKLGWKPHPKSFTAGALATHVVNMMNWAATTVKQDNFDYAAPGAPEYKEEPFESVEALLGQFDKNTKAIKELLLTSSEEAMDAPWTLLGGGKVVFTMPRKAVLRSMILSHTIHHRGQLSVYLRLLDVPVPSIYGPSADEAD